MSLTRTPIQPPLPNSGISFEIRGDAYVISGQSSGIPITLFSPEELETVEKGLRLNEKLNLAHVAKHGAGSMVCGDVKQRNAGIVQSNWVLGEWKVSFG